MANCSKCQSSIGPNDRFCPSCGASTTPVAEVPAAKLTFKERLERDLAKKGKKPAKPLPSVIVFLLIILFIGYEIHSCGTSKPASAPVVKEDAAPKPAAYKVGDSVTVGYWSYRVNSIKWAKSVGSDMLRQTADAKFLIVSVSVRNNDKTPSTMPPVKLVDAQGREFNESANGAMLENSFDLIKQLNPTVQSTGVILFDVPDGKYWAVVSGGFTSGETEKIELN